MSPRVAQSLLALEEQEYLPTDRLPGMPLLGFFAGTVSSLAIWGAIALVAWTLTS